MIHLSSSAAAAPTRFSRVAPEGGLLWRTDYFGPPPSPKGSTSVDPKAVPTLDYADPAPGETREPQAFLVEQEPHAVVHPHFHFVDQFQVVMAGGGRIGRHPIEPIMAHFAGACTAYGPIVPDERGIFYFTLRASADGTGAQFLPAAARRARPGKKRYVLADPIHPSTPDALRSRREAVTETVLREADGLAVVMLRVPPGGRLAGPDPREGAGQSIILAEGTLRHVGAPLDRWSALFVSADQRAYVAEAGPEGAEVLVLQYPRKDA